MAQVSSRLKAAVSLLKRKRCTHLLVLDSVNIEYISGFHSSNAALLISKDQRLLFSDFRYREAAASFCRRNPVWRFELIKEGNFEYLGPHLARGSTVGFESDVVTVDQLAALRKATRGCRFIPLPKEITEITIPKGPREVALMKVAARIGDRALKELTGAIRKGITEQEVARTLDRLCSQYGSEKPSFDTIVLFGARSALPHGRPGRRKLADGDWVLIDFGCTVAGFCSDMTRTFVAGKAGPRQRAFYSTVERAQRLARNAARASMSSSALDAVARKEIESAGYGDAFGHALGHGVGLRIHESPRISPHVSVKLRPGSVVTIEPGIYVAGFGGVRIEDMVVLTETGSRLLTRFPRNLIEIAI